MHGSLEDHFSVIRIPWLNKVITYLLAFLKYTDKTKILANAAVRLKDNPFHGSLIGIGADFAKDTQERRKALIPFKKHLQKKLEEQECRVFIAYPARLKYSDSKGKVITVRNEELKKMESEAKWKSKNAISRRTLIAVCC